MPTNTPGADWARTHDWGALTRHEIAQARDAGALAVLTVGSCEQHGDHLPVNTDSVSAYQVAMRAAERCATPHVLVLPAPQFGFSPHHKAWPGTITLSLSTFVAVVTDVAESVMRAGFDRLLVVNGHGGNVGPLSSACTELASRGLRVASVNYFQPGQKDWQTHMRGSKPGVGHACEYETAMQLALRPDERQRIAGRISDLPARLVPPYLDSPSNIQGNAQGNAQGNDQGNLMRDAGASYAALFVAGDPGYYGDPAAALVETGEQMLEATVDGLARFYAAFSNARLKVGEPD